MRRPEFLAKQGRCPSGLLGAVVGRIMAHETARENAAAVDLLSIESTDHVIEVGFGHGRTLGNIVNLVPNGFVAGVDASSAMLRLGSHVNRNAIARGLLEVHQADSQALPYPSRRFNKLLSVHALYFWKQPMLELREFRRVLRDGGKLVLGFIARTPSTDATFPAAIYTFRTVEEVRCLLWDAGFAEAAVTEFRSARRVVALVTARAGAL